MVRKVILVHGCKVYYNPHKSGAHYTIDGVHWWNEGQLKEALTKAGFGLKPTIDAKSVPFDEGYDVPEHHASVKSKGCSLTSKDIGKTFEEQVKTFMSKVMADKFYWVESYDETTVTIYEMDLETFEKFVRAFGVIDGKQVRIKNENTTKNKLINRERWFKMNGAR